MGQENETMLSFLEDNRRFADLFNQLYFNGRQVVDAEALTEGSESYHGELGEKSGQRTRDIKKCLRSGKELKILAVESQSEVSYNMPWRIMDYDCREYGRQIKEVQRTNETKDNAGEKIYTNAGERLSRIRREERFAPVYTLCLYHGTEPWDGPRSLKEMMDFGNKQGENGCAQEWEKCFADYPLRLVCANEPMDCSGFRTSLGNLFALLPYRRDKKRLKEILSQDTAYRKMDEDTARTISVLLGIRKFREKKEQFMTQEGEYDMCQAIQEMMNDSRQEGFIEGEAHGEIRRAQQMIEMINHIMKELHCSLERACEVCGRTFAEYQQAEGVCNKENVATTT